MVNIRSKLLSKFFIEEKVFTSQSVLFFFEKSFQKFFSTKIISSEANCLNISNRVS